MTEVRLAINTHTPRALPPPQPVDHSKPPHPNSENATGTGQPAKKRKIEYGPPALTRKDFILAWSIDMAAFRARQKEITLEQRRARRTERKESESTIVQYDQGLCEPQTHETARPTQNSATASSLASSGQSKAPPSMTINDTSPAAQHTLPNSQQTSDGHHNTTSTSSVAPVQGTIQQNEEKPGTGPTKSATTKEVRKRRLGGDGLSLQHVSLSQEKIAMITDASPLSILVPVSNPDPGCISKQCQSH